METNNPELALVEEIFECPSQPSGLFIFSVPFTKNGYTMPMAAGFRMIFFSGDMALRFSSLYVSGGKENPPSDEAKRLDF